MTIATLPIIARSGDGPAPEGATVSTITRVPPVAIVGDLDVVQPTGSGLQVMGWALTTRDTKSQPRVEITSMGEVLVDLELGRERLDITAAYGPGAADAGFAALVEPPASAHTLCADAYLEDSPARVRLGCRPIDAGSAQDSRTSLDALVSHLGRRAEAQLDGVTVAIAVVPFDTGELSGWRENRLFISASAAKAWWTAAALANGERSRASRLAGPLFEDSSDSAAGSMIDLAGGIDAVNDFTTGARMADTAVIRWSTDGINRRSELSPGRLGGSNYVDASDAAVFFYELGTNQVLPPNLTAVLGSWMTMSPREFAEGEPEASTIPDSLPPKVRATAEHKAGWLRPGSFAVPGHLLGVGIVRPANGGPAYSVALMSAGGNSGTYRRVIEFFQSASCQIYVEVAQHLRWNCPSW